MNLSIFTDSLKLINHLNLQLKCDIGAIYRLKADYSSLESVNIFMNDVRIIEYGKYLLVGTEMALGKILLALSSTLNGIR